MNSDTTHTYYRTGDSSKGLHLLTTADHEEAFAMRNAIFLRDCLTVSRAMMENIAAWEIVILESIERTHGTGATYRGIAEALAEIEKALAVTKPGAAP